MERSLPRQYFLWLYERVCTVRDTESPESYALVCDEMHVMDFRVVVPMDDNRAADGLELRDKFLSTIRNKKLDPVFERMAHDVTIFEVLVALAAQGEFMSSKVAEEWFTIFLSNLGLAHQNDRDISRSSTLRIRHNLRRFNNRTYLSNGKGGLFPLSKPLKDQRRVELWYQMGAYINENKLY